jgi:hypothetical protein
MKTRYRVSQDLINELEALPTTDPAVLAWALARIVDQRVWEVRVARFGVTLYPRQLPPITYGEAGSDD